MSVWPNGSASVPKVSSEFGPRRAPTAGASTMHLGTDLVGFAAVRAPSNGTVIFSGYNGGSGNEVRIAGDDGVEYRLKHNARLNMRRGARVSQGQQVAVMGRTGVATGVHSHFETIVKGAHANPRNVIRTAQAAPASGGGGVVNQDVKNRQTWLNQSRGERLTVDGIAGPNTKAAIARYQKFLGIAADGIWGPLTQGRHQAYYDGLHAAAPAPAPAVTSSDITRAAQQKLKTNFPAYAGKLAVDGVYGPKTRAAVVEFQRRSGLVADGIIGPRTRAALGI